MMSYIRKQLPHVYFLRQLLTFQSKSNFVNSLVHRFVAETDHFRFFSNTSSSVSSVLAADAAVNTGIFVVKHINVQIS